MATIFALWHMHQDDDGCDHEMMLGVFSTKENAQNAITSLKDQPGFRDYPDGFEIHEYPVDRVEMREGFITVRPGEE